MMRALVILVVALRLVGQMPDTARPVVFGTFGTGAGLTPDEVAQLVALAGRQAPWLIACSVSGPIANGLGIQADIYLAAERVSDTVRRGPMVVAESARMHDGTSRPWTLKGRMTEWAQVRVEQQRSWMPASDRDIQRPFPVAGDLSNVDLEAIVSLIRTSPFAPYGTGSRGERRRIPGDWPVGKLVRNPTSATVYLLEPRSERSGYAVALSRVQSAWQVVSFQLWLGGL